MKIILREDVPNLGKAGEVATVRDGYGRNFLIPQGKAVLASEKNIRQLDHQKRIIMARQAKLKASAEAVAQKIGQVQLTIARKVGEQEKLYGSVTNKDLADALAQVGVEVDRHQIQLAEPIRTLGQHEVPVRLHSEVVPTIKVEVVPEQ